MTDPRPDRCPASAVARPSLRAGDARADRLSRDVRTPPLAGLLAPAPTAADFDAQVQRLVRTLLHEGYLLYPYRPSALKNRYRWTIGALLPPVLPGERGSEPSALTVDLLAQAPAGARLRVRVRCLHVRERLLEDGQPWQEASEREVAPDDVVLGGPALVIHEASIPADTVGAVTEEPLSARVEVGVEPLVAGAWRISLRIVNTAAPLAAATPRARAILRALVSTHALLRIEGGSFVSLREPPPALAQAAAACRCEGAWPVLLTAPPLGRDLLVSPVIVDEPPALAPESPGDLFDATEMDEMLALRVQTLAPHEAREAQADPRARDLLRCVDELRPAALSALHGAVRDLAPASPVASPGPGARVRLRPRRRADVLDLALEGRAGTVVAVERDVEGNAHLAVVIDDDPGRDLGVKGDVPGHRFFFAADEVERLIGVGHGGQSMAERPTRVLVAGIGNELRGDDGFGLAVVRQLRQGSVPEGVVVREVGTRSFDLALALLEADVAILVDAAARGGAPGALYVIEVPRLAPVANPDPAAGPGSALLDPHALHPAAVMSLVRGLGGEPPPMTVVGCEPGCLASEEEPSFDLSPPVQEAVARAVDVVLELALRARAKGATPRA